MAPPQQAQPQQQQQKKKGKKGANGGKVEKRSWPEGVKQSWIGANYSAVYNTLISRNRLQYDTFAMAAGEVKTVFAALGLTVDKKYGKPADNLRYAGREIVARLIANKQIVVKEKGTPGEDADIEHSPAPFEDIFRSSPPVGPRSEPVYMLPPPLPVPAPPRPRPIASFFGPRVDPPVFLRTPVVRGPPSSTSFAGAGRTSPPPLPPTFSVPLGLIQPYKSSATARRNRGQLGWKLVRPHQKDNVYCIGGQIDAREIMRLHNFADENIKKDLVERLKNPPDDDYGFPKVDGARIWLSLAAARSLAEDLDVLDLVNPLITAAELGIEPAGWECEGCGKNFMQLADMIKHNNSHTGIGVVCLCGTMTWGSRNGDHHRGACAHYQQFHQQL